MFAVSKHEVEVVPAKVAHRSVHREVAASLHELNPIAIFERVPLHPIDRATQATPKLDQPTIADVDGMVPVEPSIRPHLVPWPEDTSTAQSTLNGPWGGLEQERRSSSRHDYPPKSFAR
jgi:hypothetical protein